MTDDTMPLLDALPKRGGGKFMKSLIEEVLARLMSYDVEGQMGLGASGAARRVRPSATSIGRAPSTHAWGRWS